MPGDSADVIVQLRKRPQHVLLFRGFGPLVAALIFLGMMLWLAPSVAPEHVVDKPLHAATTVPITIPATTPPTSTP
jgi:hypothetical protein